MSRSIQELDAVQIHEMDFEELDRHCVMVPVRASPKVGLSVMDPLSSDQADLGSMRTEVVRSFSNQGHDRARVTELTNRLVSGCLKSSFDGDLWMVRLPRGKALVLVKEPVLKEFSRGEILRQIHGEAVSDAISQGMYVPDVVASAYKQGLSGTAEARH